MPPPESPAHGGVLGGPEGARGEAGAAKEALFQPGKGELHPQLTSSPPPYLPWCRFVLEDVGPEAFPLTFFCVSRFSFIYTKVKVDNYFFTWKNTITDKNKCLFFAYRWLKFSAALSPLKVISSSMQAKMCLHVLLVVISVIKRL